MRARGWLLLLCLLLAVWEPLSLALLASSVLPRILDRPAAVAILMVRLAVTGLGVAAGLALWRGRPHGVPMAKLALVCSVLTVVLMLWTPYFPRNHVPGSEGQILIVSLAYNVAWYVYLDRSQQVKRLLTVSLGARPEDEESGSRLTTQDSEPP